jgi:hypothetical protein
MSKVVSVCINGHLKTPENTYNDQGWLRCKTCIGQQKALRYKNDALFRKRRLAYSHWWSCGDPQGRTWQEIRKEITA